MVFNSVIDFKVNHDFLSLTLEDMYFHLHIASIHYGLPTTKSIDLVNLMLHESSKHKQIIQYEMKEWSDTYFKSIVQVLTNRGIMKDQDEATSILQEIKDCVETELQTTCGKRFEDNGVCSISKVKGRTIFFMRDIFYINTHIVPPRTM